MTILIRLSLLSVNPSHATANVELSSHYQQCNTMLRRSVLSLTLCWLKTPQFGVRSAHVRPNTEKHGKIGDWPHSHFLCLFYLMFHGLNHKRWQWVLADHATHLAWQQGGQWGCRGGCCYLFMGLSLKRRCDDIVSSLPPRVHPGVAFTHLSWRQ